LIKGKKKEKRKINVKTTNLSLQGGKKGVTTFSNTNKEKNPRETQNQEKETAPLKLRG